MRGKGFSVKICLFGNRITPAYAGKSDSDKKMNKLYQDHPRLCGEKNMVQYLIISDTGSPPPMRGKVLSHLPSIVNKGITPAYAGKSTVLPSCRSSIGGSPPPMRGKAAHYTGGSIECRITPAYAGKSTNCFQICGFREDHPRLCGEKTKKILKQRYFFHQPASFSFSLQYT